MVSQANIAQVLSKEYKQNCASDGGSNRNRVNPAFHANPGDRKLVDVTENDIYKEEEKSSYLVLS
jgi:hypothetical protein